MADDKKPEKPAVSDAKDAPKAEPAPAVKVVHAEQRAAAWGEPIVRLDRAWTKLEARLCAAVLAAEVLTLVFWISIRALSSPGTGGPGQLFRRMLTAAIFGSITWWIVRKRPHNQIITTAAVALGVVVGSPSAGSRRRRSGRCP